jgi:hypothetical protein
VHEAMRGYGAERLEDLIRAPCRPASLRGAATLDGNSRSRHLRCVKNSSPSVLAVSKGSSASSPVPQYAQRLPLPESAETSLSASATVQPCNRSGFGNSSISSGKGSPRTNRAGRPFRSSRLRNTPASTATVTRRDTTDLSSLGSVSTP